MGEESGNQDLRPVQLRQFAQLARLYVSAERDAHQRHRPGNFGAVLGWADHRFSRVTMAAIVGGLAPFAGGTWTNPTCNVAVTLVGVAPRHRGRDVRMAVALHVLLGAGASAALLLVGMAVPILDLGWQDAAALLAVMAAIGMAVGLSLPWMDRDRRVYRRAFASTKNTNGDHPVFLVSGLVSRGSAHDVLSAARTLGRGADRHGWTLIATTTDRRLAGRYRRLFGFADIKAARPSSTQHLIRLPQPYE